MQGFIDPPCLDPFLDPKISGSGSSKKARIQRIRIRILNTACKKTNQADLLQINQAIWAGLGLSRYLQNHGRISDLSGQFVTGFEGLKALKYGWKIPAIAL